MEIKKDTHWSYISPMPDFRKGMPGESCIGIYPILTLTILIWSSS